MGLATGGRWITVNGNHILITDSGGGSAGGGAIEFANTGESLNGATKESSVNWHRRHMSDFNSSATPNQRHAIDAYSGNYYVPMNQMLRKGKLHPQEDRHNIRQLNVDLYKSLKPIDASVVVYRGINGDVPRKQGSIVKDRAFVSTSLSRGVGLDFSRSKQLTVARIVVPRGTRVGFGNTSNEQEVILPPGTKFRIGKTSTGKTNIGHAYNQVEMSIVPYTSKRKRK